MSGITSEMKNLRKSVMMVNQRKLEYLLFSPNARPVNDMMPILENTAMKEMRVKMLVKMPLSFAEAGKGLQVSVTTFSLSIMISKKLLKKVTAIRIGKPNDQRVMYPN
jgi:hypothetical protein